MIDQRGSRSQASVSRTLISSVCVSEDESHLLLHSHLTMEDLESPEFKVHDPSVSWLSGKDHSSGPPSGRTGSGCCPVRAVSYPPASLSLSLPESEVALRTREGHVLSFSLSSNLTTTLLDNSSLVSYSAWRRRTGLTVDRLVTRRRVGQIGPPVRAEALPD